MSNSMEQTARSFFKACETGDGWQGCSQYCKPDASFAAQAEPLADVKTLEAYTEWMKGLYTFMPDAGYELKSWAVDGERNNVLAYAIFFGTHTDEGGPLPPTGKSVRSDYVYVMSFDGDKISHLTKIWPSDHALKQLGWM
jgi:predicted ester cyclase